MSSTESSSSKEESSSSSSTTTSTQGSTSTPIASSSTSVVEEHPIIVTATPNMAPIVDPKLAQKALKDSLGKNRYDGKVGVSHKFWDKEPVLKFGDTVDVDQHCPIDVIKTVDEIQAEPYGLPDVYSWVEIDVNDPKDMTDVYQLLYNNYVEDGDSLFRFDYSIDFLTWALTPPHWRRIWHLGVRATAAPHALVGFISAIPASIRSYDHIIPMVEINFLCVHKKLRSKRLAPLLIKEITRRVNRVNIWQAVYTAGILLPNPVVSAQYHHRSLNPKKLIEVRFSGLPRGVKITAMQKLYKLPNDPVKFSAAREMTPADVPSAFKLLFDRLAKFHVALHLDEQEFAHWLLPRKGVVYSYVRTDPEGNVTDLLSFYSLPSTIIGNPKHKTLFAAYCFYNVATTVTHLQLMTDCLILAKKTGHDVFNALDIMDNQQVFKELKFGTGDGHLSYYFYNWKCPLTTPPNLGLVML